MKKTKLKVVRSFTYPDLCGDMGHDLYWDVMSDGTIPNYHYERDERIDHYMDSETTLEWLENGGNDGHIEEEK